MADIEVTQDESGSRYVATADGAEAGKLTYRRTDESTIALVHTEVDKAFGGQGVGSLLTRYALDKAREQGQRVIPFCPFVAAWIDKHPDYADLVAD